MRAWTKKISPYLMLLAAFAVFIAVFLLHRQFSTLLNACLCAAGGLLMGFGAVGIALSGVHLTPEQKKEIALGQTDERNIAIREKAAMSSWYWTLYLLWAAFIVIQIFAGELWGVAVSVLIVLHCTFYMVNIHRWNKKL